MAPSHPELAPVVVTGAAGFIGRAFVARLAARGISVIALTRRPTPALGTAQHAVGEITAATDWTPLLAGARAVVHLASRAHVPLGTGDQSWISGEAAAAEHLARAAARAGVARVVLLSSIKVLGEKTEEAPFRATDPPAPEDAYGRAKERIEDAMRAALAEPATLAIIRPPLVYGPGVKANFRTLLRLVDSGMPLPFAGVANRRSLVFIENLVDLIETALVHPAAPGGTFLVRDGEDVSTAELVRRIAHHLQRPARLFRCPESMLRLAARTVGRSGVADRLLDSLEVDDSATRERLGWQPRMTLDDGLAATCRWFRAERHR